jgi:hypothetical protein
MGLQPPTTRLVGGRSIRKSTTMLAKGSQATKQPKSWDQAIVDAEELLDDPKGQKRELTRSIELFKRLRDRGAALRRIEDRGLT